MAKSRTSPEQAGAAAEALALHALAFLAEDPERLGRFLALTGIGPADLKARAGEPEFLGGVLDHLLGDERLLLAFSKEYECRRPPRHMLEACCREPRPQTDSSVELDEKGCVGSRWTWNWEQKTWPRM